MNPRHWQLPLIFSVIAVLSAIICNTAFAYSTYDGCKDCHGGFRDNPYTSLSDGSNWGDDLHDVHRTTMLDGDCDTCHGSSKSPVSLDTSAGGSGLSAISCVGCHGREEDMGNDSESAGRGAGLRQHHTNAGELDCMDCHDDADPANYTPVGEDVLPDYYANPGSNHPAIPTDSCNPLGTENFAGTSIGLDNDGDGQTDGSDSDCQTANTPPTQPGALSASLVTTNSATVNWGASTDTDGDTITYQVEYRRNGDALWTNGGSTTDTSRPLSGLDGNQSYDVQVTPNDGTEDGPVRTTPDLFQTEIDSDDIFKDGFEGN